ncbi:MAG: hypothetical protein JW969_07310 [Spirochaetales bacterium]|nr:hypothetical protein [Spirochaetales bacterium]
MMISKITLEIILFVLVLMPPGNHKGEFEMTANNKKPVKMEYQIVQEGEDEFAVHDITVFPKGKKESVIKFSFTDNALYRVELKDAEPYLIDLVPYLSVLDWEKKISQKQQIEDSSGKPLMITPKKKTVVFESPSKKLKLVFGKNLFEELSE